MTQNPYQDPPATTAPGSASPKITDTEAQTWTMLCHLGGFAAFLGPGILSIGVPLVIWLLKRHEHPEIDRHGREAVSFQITIAIYWVIGFVLLFVGIGFIVLGIASLLWLICTIVATVKASHGEFFRYPATIRFL